MKKDEVYYYHADGLGSITALTDKKQKVVLTYEYDSFGNVKQNDSKIQQPYTFTGREWDEEVGLYYYRARYYDSKNGRFTLQKDPIGFTGGINLYAYVKSNPVNTIDPSGLMGCKGDPGMPEGLAKLIGEIPAEILGMIVEKTTGSITGAACASKYCKNSMATSDWLKAYSTCSSIFVQYNIPPGIPPLTLSNEYISACASECISIINRASFKEYCGCK